MFFSFGALRFGPLTRETMSYLFEVGGHSAAETAAHSLSGCARAFGDSVKQAGLQYKKL